MRQVHNPKVTNILLKIFRKETGHYPSIKKPIQSTELCEIIEVELGDKKPPATIRKSINFIRENYLAPIGSNKNGYYICESEGDFEETSLHLLGRIRSLQDALFGIEKMKADFLTNKPA